ncbi:hypothetical protein OSB04_026810 [Centaurea solstitialis]|uniref:F-box domain-containing protein n=1 Tax=Centaurea solstitialis TaxID=347529 RepID=A0AA38W7L4_9ASTR|nr:hypothetical protein OSB04_026810 [Centaurea solstitialis]
MADTKTNMKEEEDKNRARMEDRLENLPESLQFHILTLLNTKKAVQISMLSKQWLSIWTSKPVLHLNSSDFRWLDDFDNFVNHVLRHRDHSAELNTLTFTRRGYSSRNFVKEVLEYAISHGVNHLTLLIERFENDYNWDVNNCLHTSSNSLKTLKLKTQSHTRPVLSGSFKNLTILYLKRAIIVKDHEPFLLGFPMLEKLVLKDCYLGKILGVEALKLSDLTISDSCFGRCELTTPNLRFFKYRGSYFQELQTNGGLPALDTVVIDSNGFRNPLGKRLTIEDLVRLVRGHGNTKKIEDLVSLFRGLGNAKSVTLSSSMCPIRLILSLNNHVQTKYVTRMGMKMRMQENENENEYCIDVMMLLG